MAADLTTLQTRLDALKGALASGTQSVSYGNYHKQFRSVAEIQQAIKDVESDIADLGGNRPVRTFKFCTQKGL